MNLYQLTEVQLLFYALIFLRCIAFIFSSAIFGQMQISTPVKILLSLLLAICLGPTLKMSANFSTGIQTQIIAFAAMEVVFGLMLGFLTRLVLFALGQTGELVSTALGLNSAQLFNPALGVSSTAFDQLYVLLGTLLFLSLRGHHLLLIGLQQSFDVLSIGFTQSLTLSSQFLGTIVQKLMWISLQMASPVMVSIMLANVALGILGKAVPQLNVLVTSFPVTILLGMGVIFICLPMLLAEMNGITVFSEEVFKAAFQELRR